MINYEDEKNLKKLIKLENDSLSSSLDIQESLYTQLLKFMKNFIGDINLNEYFGQDDEFQKNVTNCINQISKSNNNIAIIKDLIKDINNFSNVNLNDEIQEYNKKKYSSMQDVIDKLYTIPIKYYKFTSIARFKEAYNLVTKKENRSKISGIKLGLELMPNYNLHPAIISACNSVDELDMYLACLHDNILDDFHIFNIKYEIAPILANYKK